MKKLLASLLAVVLCLSVLAGCGSKKADLALVTDLGTIDDKSFNQGAWEGLVKYAEENNISKQYYQPTEQSTDAYLETIDLAVKGGAKVIVTPGYLFQEPLTIAQDSYPDVTFIGIDVTVVEPKSNVVGITYAEQQAGFLAGYAAVKDGMTKLGFMGGLAVPAVVRYGYGFVQGAEYAAQEMGLGDGSIEMMYNYTGVFAATPEAQAMASTWYQGGTEVVFACGGAVGNSVMAAAEAAGTKVIGVDVDQSSESATVITSAMKGIGTSVYDAVKAYYDGSFPGGQNIVVDASTNGVGLAMDTAKFETFTQADYDAIFAKMANDTDKVASNILTDADVAGVTELPLKAVKVTEVV